MTVGGFPKRPRIVNEKLLRAVARLPCLACPQPSREAFQAIVDDLDHAPRISDPHHVTTRGAGGGDVAENVMPLCPKHHQEYHRRGGREMADRYPRVLAWLQGFNRTDVLGKVDNSLS